MRVVGWCIVLICGLVGLPACTRAPTSAAPPRGEPAPFAVPGLPLFVPRQAGWTVDPSVPADANQVGGLVLRLVRQSAVPGSPRIEVALTPPHPRPTLVEEFLTHNLQEMADLEKSGALHLRQVDQSRRDIGACKAYRVHQQYSLQSGPSTVVVEQLSTLLVLQGRGVAVTAAGRSELFAPQRPAIESILDGLRFTPAPGPIDLGQLGRP
jgi:hypothetical protein